MKGGIQADQTLQQQYQQQQQPPGGCFPVNGKGGSGSNNELNLNDVLEVIRHSDPATFQEFQTHLTAMAARQQQQQNSTAVAADQLLKQKRAAYVKITEQPASKGLRFRYECEGRSAGSIPGVNSTNEHKTFPSIEVVGYKGRAVVVVSCVSAEQPYRPHPHSLVGKEGCKKGVCTLEIPNETMSLTFSSLGIQCVKKKEIEDALTLRQQIRVDPFQTGFGHRETAQTSLDLNCVRLCFQVFLEGNEKGAFTFALKPVVSAPIFDKKAKNDLTICRITDCSASVSGGKEMLLFCDKVVKDDIQVRFYQEEEKTGKVIWEGFGEFQPSDVHKQYGIAFRTPRYHNLEIEEKVRVQLQLRRPSDGICSDPRPFDFLPLDSGRGFWTAKRLKTNYSVFSSILTADQQRMLRDNKQPEEQLKRKSRVLQPAAATTTTPETTMVSSFPPPPPPARNFHSLSLVPHVTNTNNSALTSTATSPEGATLLQQQQQLQLLQLQRQRQLQQQQQLLQQRPLSMLSDTSSVVTVATDASSGKQSLNDVLSLAGREENMSVYSVDLSGAGDMTFQALMKMEPDQQQQPSVDTVTVLRPAGSITSVDTVKENIIKQEKETTPVNTDNNNMDMDVNTLYDDVMQCVYDDVAAEATTNATTTEPPAPPARIASVLVSTPTEASSSSSTSQETILLTSPDKPLPETPSKLPTILQSMMGSGGVGKGDTLAREKKRKEQEELKRRYKEEREVERQKQKERKKKAAATAAGGGKGSLFQRVLHRSKSQSELAGVNNNNEDNAEEVNANSVTPEISSHNSAVADAALKLEPGSNNSGSSNNNNAGGGDPTEADLNELQQFLESGDLDHLDNMVSEFAKQYLPGTELEESAATNTEAGSNNNNNSVQQQQHQQGRVS